MSGTPTADTQAAEDARLARFVEDSSARVAALDRLAEAPMSPSRIAADARTSTGRTLAAINELRERDLVELYVPTDDDGNPVFGLTERGERVTFLLQ
jgi:predicted transcriptional regulator